MTTHGFAINVATDLDWFGHINPCGITDRQVTTVSEVLGRKVSLEEMVEVLLPRFVEVFGYPGRRDPDGGLHPGHRQGGSRTHEVDRLVEGGAFDAGPGRHRADHHEGPAARRTGEAAGG